MPPVYGGIPPSVPDNPPPIPPGYVGNAPTLEIGTPPVYGGMLPIVPGMAPTDPA